MVIVQNQKAHEHDIMQRGPKYVFLTKTYFLLDGNHSILQCYR
jgi:hypothetical protein